MADWFGSARTNYFQVKDADVFRAWAANNSLFAFEQDGRFGAYSETFDGGWPSTIEDDDAEEGFREFDIVAELLPHVEEGEIVVCLQVGAEKLRYLTGSALAFRVAKDGVEQIYLSLNDIYARAKERWGVEPTEAMY